MMSATYGATSGAINCSNSNKNPLHLSFFRSPKDPERMDDVKLGTLVGEDKYGNKYYENKMYFYGRNRWVEYADEVFLDYDGSQVPAEWYGWLHYKTDLPPFKDPHRPKYPWMADHQENMSGTEKAYMPYSTTLPKIQAWVPPKPASKS